MIAESLCCGVKRGRYCLSEQKTPSHLPSVKLFKSQTFCVCAVKTLVPIGKCACIVTVSWRKIELVQNAIFLLQAITHQTKLTQTEVHIKKYKKIERERQLACSNTRQWAFCCRETDLFSAFTSCVWFRYFSVHTLFRFVTFGAPQGLKCLFSAHANISQTKGAR